MRRASTRSPVCGSLCSNALRREARAAGRVSGAPAKRVCSPSSIKLKAAGIVTESSKRCTKCDTVKPVGEFRSRGGSMKHLLKSWCKACHFATHKTWCAENQDRVKEYRGRDPWTLVKRCARHGITPEEFVIAYEAQAGRCLICEDPISQMGSAIDHNHKTGKFRGILCKTCNRAIGMLRDSPSILRRAAEYLETRGSYGDGAEADTKIAS